jgi:hypothetical protein
MDDSTRQLGELRALLVAHGPASVLSTVAALCADEAKARADGEDGELWEVAADAANGAATALSNEDEDEGADPDEEEEEETDDEEDEDREEGEGDAETTAPAAVVEECSDGGTREETPKERGRAMAKDQRLGQRSEKATDWRCFRLEPSGDRKLLAFDAKGDGILANEWPIRTCSADLIADRWGDGQYVVQYIMVDADGKRRPVGRSRALLVQGRSPIAAGPPLPDEAPLPAAVPMPAPPPPPPPPAPMPVAAPQTTLGTLMDPWAVITYMRDAEARAHAEARALSHQELQRISGETKEREARYRAEMDLQMERERLASKERIVQMELQAKAMGRGGRAPDPEIAELRALVTKLVERQDEDDEEDDDDDEYVMVPEGSVAPSAPAAPAAPPDPVRDAIAQVMPHLGGIAQFFAAKLMDGKGPLSIPDIPSPKKDPSNKPN